MYSPSSLLKWLGRGFLRSKKWLWGECPTSNRLIRRSLLRFATVFARMYSPSSLLKWLGRGFLHFAVYPRIDRKKVLICDTNYVTILLGGDLMYKKNLKCEIHVRLTEEERKYIETLCDMVNEKPSFVVRAIINNYRLRYHNEGVIDDVNV